MNADSRIMSVPLWVLAVAVMVVLLILVLVVISIAKSLAIQRARTGRTSLPNGRQRLAFGSAAPNPANWVTAQEFGPDIFEVTDPSVTPQPPNAPSVPSRELLASTSDAAAWELCWGLRQRVVDGRLQVDGAIRSVASLDAVPGAIYVCEYSVRAPHTLISGRPLIYYAGPISLNAQGEMIQPFAEQAPITIEEGAREGAVLLKAAPNAHLIYIGLQGPTGDDRHGALPEFEWIRLTRK